MTAEMFERLGLQPGTSLDDVPVAHDEIVRFLASAPRSIRLWAHDQAEQADAAYAALTDTVAPARAEPDALVDGAQTMAARPDELDRQPARRVTPPPAAPVAAAQIPMSEMSEDDRIETLLASVTPSHHRDSVPVAKATKPAGGVSVTLRIPGRRFLATAGLMVALAAVAVVGYGMGGQNVPLAAGDGSGTGDATTGDASTGTGIDQTKVAELMTRIAADPNDADALLGIGDEYFQTGDYTTAVDWFRKAITADASNVKGPLALGAALFNEGDADGAEIQWQHAVDLDAANVEAHYDLGFLNLNREPPDMEAVKREWNEVIRLAPGSAIAETVQTHLTALASTAPDASGAPGATPSAAPAGSAKP